MGAWQCLQDASNGIDIGSPIGLCCTGCLLWSRILIGTPHRVGVAIGIRIAQVDEFDIVADTGNKDIAWLQVEMNDLMAVQITYDTEQLA